MWERSKTSPCVSLKQVQSKDTAETLSLWWVSKRTAATHPVERYHLPWSCARLQMTWKDLFTSLKMNQQVIRPTVTPLLSPPMSVLHKLCSSKTGLCALIPQGGSEGWRPRLSPCSSRFWNAAMRFGDGHCEARWAWTHSSVTSWSHAKLGKASHNYLQCIIHNQGIETWSMIAFKKRCRNGILWFCIATAAGITSGIYFKLHLYSKTKFIRDEDVRGMMKRRVQIRQLESGIVLSEATLFVSYSKLT